MRKISIMLLLLFMSIWFYSCDPGYYLLISNHSEYDKQIQLKAFSKNIEFYEADNNIFKKRDFLRKDTFSVKGKYESLLLPAGQVIKVDGVGIAIPRGESLILKSDTIDASTFQSKGGFFSFVKWAYSIKD